MQYSLSDLKHIARYVVGNENAEQLPDENKIDKQMERLNTALSRGGRIVGQEKKLLSTQYWRASGGFAIYRISRWIRKKALF